MLHETPGLVSLHRLVKEDVACRLVQVSVKHATCREVHNVRQGTCSQRAAMQPTTSCPDSGPGIHTSMEYSVHPANQPADLRKAGELTASLVGWHSPGDGMTWTWACAVGSSFACVIRDALCMLYRVACHDSQVRSLDLPCYARAPCQTLYDLFLYDPTCTTLFSCFSKLLPPTCSPFPFSPMECLQHFQ